MRDGERSERLLTCRTASNGYKHFSAVKRVSRIRLLRIEMIYLDGCLARTQIVLNGGPVAVTAAPATGRLKADPLQPPHHRANWPLPARGGVWSVVSAVLTSASVPRADGAAKQMDFGRYPGNTQTRRSPTRRY